MAKKEVKKTAKSKKTTKRSTKSVVRKNKGKARTKRTSKKGSKAQVFQLSPFIQSVLTILVCLLLCFIFYYTSIRPYAYRWRPCHGNKFYDVCMPSSYTIHGIDISRHQGSIDWPRLAIYQNAEVPIRFIFFKATEGGDFKDKTFDYNYAQAKQFGFIRGAYHFFSPHTSAQKQARHFIRTVRLEKGDLPPVLDVEVLGKHSKKSIKDSVKVWLSLVEKHYKTKPILYTSYKFKNKYLNDSVLNSYPFWIAHYYVPELRYTGQWMFWQHSDVGVIPGIEQKVDLNVFNGTFDELEAFTLP